MVWQSCKDVELSLLATKILAHGAAKSFNEMSWHAAKAKERQSQDDLRA